MNQHAASMYWPGQEYLRMSRIYATYSAGALLGPALGAFGWRHRAVLTYALLLALMAAPRHVPCRCT